MKEFNLQLFAEAVRGKRLVYLYRVYSAGKTKKGAADIPGTSSCLSHSDPSFQTAA